MFGLFKRKTKQAPIAADPLDTGFFSTGLPVSRMDQWAYKAAALAKSFQQPAPTPVTIGHGMDESIQAVKARFAGMTTDMPTMLTAWYGAQGFIGWQLAAMIAQHWLIAKVCRMPAEDAVRHWFTIDAEGDIPKLLAKEDKRYKLKHNLTQFLTMGRVFGVRHVLFKVRSADPDYYIKPFNPDGITPGSYIGMVQVDPYWMAPELDAAAAGDPASSDFYEPTWWNISGKRYHKSHFVIFRNGELADILKPTYLYGGIPVPQKIMERVYAAERTANEAPLLAMTKRLNVQKVDMAKAIAKQAEFEERVHYQQELRDNFGSLFVGKEDTVEQIETSLADLDSVIMTQYQIVAAGGEVPSTKLLGTSPKGFNATGEHETRSYHESLESLQSNDMSPVVERHHICVIRSSVAPTMGVPPFAVDHKWNPVDSPTALEEATVNKTKAETDKLLFDVGAVDGANVQDRLQNDAGSGYSFETITDETTSGTV